MAESGVILVVYANQFAEAARMGGFMRYIPVLSVG